MPEDPLPVRVYRKLLSLYPAGFHDQYGAAMERAFRDELAESGGILLWLRLLADLAVSIPAQFAREVAQDARHTFRLWAARPWHTGFAILALAIGIGANTGVFSVVNALLLRSLPFRDPERLATLDVFFAPHDSPKHFNDWRTQSTYLADAALWEGLDANLGSAGEWRRVRVVETSWNFFALLGTQPMLGRAFAPEEEAEGNGWGPPGPNAVAVISHGLWQSLYGGDGKALGSTIRIDGNPLTVIGVAPPGFDYPGQAAVWKPAAYAEGNYGWTTIARLKPGITWGQARGPFLAEADRLYPGRRRLGAMNKPSTITPLGDELAGPTKHASLVLMGCVLLVLLIACTNVANLLTARTADRTAELSIRSALGASRARLSQQLLTECVLLSLAAAVAGLLVALATTSIAAKLQPAPLATQTYSILDGRVLSFAIGVSVLSGLLFGVLPSFYAGRVHAFGTRGSTDTRRSREVREVLVAAQVMLTVVLLTASISVGRAFLHLMSIDRGFVRAGVVSATVSLQGTTRNTESGRMVYFQEALDRIRRLPGVRSASTTQFLPLDAKGFIGGRCSLDGRRASMSSANIPVMPDYFRTMGGRIVAGREFTEADLQANASVAIVNEGFAREFGQPADVVGHELENGEFKRKVIGVVRGMDYMTEGAQSSQIFTLSRSPGWPGTAFVVKVDGRPEDHIARIRDTIQSVDPQVPVFDVKTMDDRMAGQFARPQFYKTAVTFFAAFALLLAIIGIYGIVSYTVARRSHEMGVRMALGTTPENLRATLLRQGLLPIALGAVPGVAIAVLSGRLLESLVDGAKAVDAATYAGSVLFIGCVAAVGIWIATRPIARLDIVEILRTQ
jgi:putative ABC transport system permease protein